MFVVIAVTFKYAQKTTTCRWPANTWSCNRNIVPRWVWVENSKIKVLKICVERNVCSWNNFPSGTDYVNMLERRLPFQCSLLVRVQREEVRKRNDNQRRKQKIFYHLLMCLSRFIDGNNFASFFTRRFKINFILFIFRLSFRTLKEEETTYEFFHSKHARFEGIQTYQQTSCVVSLSSYEKHFARWSWFNFFSFASFAQWIQI